MCHGRLAVDPTGFGPGDGRRLQHQEPTSKINVSAAHSMLMPTPVDRGEEAACCRPQIHISDPKQPSVSPPRKSVLVVGCSNAPDAAALRVILPFTRAPDQRCTAGLRVGASMTPQRCAENAFLVRQLVIMSHLSSSCSLVEACAFGLCDVSYRLITTTQVGSEQCQLSLLQW